MTMPNQESNTLVLNPTVLDGLDTTFVSSRYNIRLTPIPFRDDEEKFIQMYVECIESDGYVEEIHDKVMKHFGESLFFADEGPFNLYAWAKYRIIPRKFSFLDFYHLYCGVVALQRVRGHLVKCPLGCTECSDDIDRIVELFKEHHGPFRKSLRWPGKEIYIKAFNSLRWSGIRNIHQSI